MSTNITGEQQTEFETKGTKIEFGREKKTKFTTIYVNSHKVRMRGKSATGLEIKEAAIKHGVVMERNFVLQMELPNGTGKVVGNDDKIRLCEDLRFTAIAFDDNS